MAPRLLGLAMLGVLLGMLQAGDAAVPAVLAAPAVVEALAHVTALSMVTLAWRRGQRNQLDRESAKPLRSVQELTGETVP